MREINVFGFLHKLLQLVRAYFLGGTDGDPNFVEALDKLGWNQALLRAEQFGQELRLLQAFPRHVSGVARTAIWTRLKSTNSRGLPQFCQHMVLLGFLNGCVSRRHGSIPEVNDSSG